MKGHSLVAALLLSASVARGQIVTENAGVQSPETPELQERFEYGRFQSARDLSFVQGLVVGLDRENELRLRVPFTWRRFESAGGDADFSGFGDATLHWKHALSREDDVMRSNRWSLIASVTAPTGDNSRIADGIVLPNEARLSLGDWTFALGAATTHISDRHRWSAALMFRHSTPHEGFQRGDEFDLNLAYWYRLLPAVFATTEDVTEVRGVLELLTSWRADSQYGGTKQDDGGVIAWLAPGLQVFPADACLLQMNIELPLAQSVDDALGTRHFAASLTVKILF